MLFYLLPVRWTPKTRQVAKRESRSYTYTRSEKRKGQDMQQTRKKHRAAFKATVAWMAPWVDDQYSAGGYLFSGHLRPSLLLRQVSKPSDASKLREYRLAGVTAQLSVLLSLMAFPTPAA